MNITCLKVGEMGTNCYLVSDEATQETLIIDPGDEVDFISTTILEQKLIPQAIVLTHGHYDHCLGVLELKLNFQIPIYLHKEDLFLYTKAHTSASFWSGKTRHCAIRYSEPKQSPPLRLPPIDHFLTDNEVIKFGQSNLKVIHTPGHTPGSICLLSPSVIANPPCGGCGNLTPPATVLFTGDTLFAEGVGRTDFSYSSPSDLKKSMNKLKSEIRDLKSVLIYPGHEKTPVFLSDLT